MSTRRRVVLFASVLVLHYALTWASLLYLVSGLSRLEHGAPETHLDTTARLLFRTLSAPLMPLVFQFRLGAWFPGWWGHLLYLANGALWAGAVVWLASRVIGKTRKPTSSLAV